ncbi:uncharacterized protein LOC135384726 [Ornithodoros turicata]|uniref:uncharacterized protein LOC135384726 n=1 Tax=Ornithodoros turicata TaxID=34597 RepID=UPI003139D7F7
MSHGDPQAPAQPLPPSLAGVAVKLPPYFDRNPAVWFLQAEAQFDLASVTTQQTKFYHVISALTPAAAEEVYDVLATSSPTPPYDQLKKALLQRITVSDRSCIQQLLSAEELGDRRPTQLLRRMRQLLGSQPTVTDDTFFRELFLQRLLQNVQMVLATASDISLDKLATLADAVVEVANPAVSAVIPATSAQPSPSPSPPTQPPPSSEVADLCREVKNLAALVAASYVSPQARPFSRRRTSRSPRRFRHRSPTPRDSSPAHTVCWYHRKFVADARHCFLPCSSQPGNSGVDH